MKTSEIINLLYDQFDDRHPVTANGTEVKGYFNGYHASAGEFSIEISFRKDGKELGKESYIFDFNKSYDQNIAYISRHADITAKYILN